MFLSERNEPTLTYVRGTKYVSSSIFLLIEADGTDGFAFCGRFVCNSLPPAVSDSSSSPNTFKWEFKSKILGEFQRRTVHHPVPL